MVLELSDGRSRLVVTPENGGGIARFDALVTGRAPVALLRPWDGAGPLGCELLIPWSNRISGGGFEFDGRFHAVEPNVAGEALPLHGDGFQRPWRVAGKTATEIELILDHGAIGPYRYVASIVYELQDGSLNATLDGREPGLDPAALWPRIPSLVPTAPRHAAAGEGQARLARGRAPSAGRDGAGRRASGLGLHQRRFAARRLDQQWLRRMGRKRGRSFSRKTGLPFPCGHRRCSTCSSSTRPPPMPASSASNRCRIRSTRTMAKG